MAIKWNDIKSAVKWNSIKKKITNNRAMLLNFLMVDLAVAEIVFLAWVCSGISLVFYELPTVLLFVFAVPLLGRIATLVLRRLDRKNKGSELERYSGALQKYEETAFVCVAAYLLTALLVLVYGKRYEGYGGYEFIIELIEYRMQWIIWCILLVPTCSFGIPFFAGIRKRQKALFSQVEGIEARIEEAVKERTKSEQMKIDLITNVSHDLKTPLTSVIGYIALMQKEEMSQTMKDYVEVLFHKTDMLKEMIEKVFDLAKASSGNVKLNLERLEINCLVEQTLADMQDIIEKEKKVFKLELAGDDTAVMADGDYMYRIVQNLIGNAIKYSLEGTRIFIITRIRGGQVIFEIINVSNYPLDFDAAMFKERFVRADESRSSQGNGIGLAIVETYTNALGGQFTIYTEGDTFKAELAFPMAE